MSTTNTNTPATPAPTTKSAAELVSEARGVIEASQTRIGELEELTTKQAADIETLKANSIPADTIKQAAAYGPEIVDGLIAAGRIPADKRDQAIANMGNPVKVAAELANVVKLVQVPSTGRVESPSDTAKQASTAEHAMQSVDDRFRQQIGLG